MDVIFEVEGKEPFSIEVGFFDTILEFKEKVQKYQGIPISKQTLIFNGQVLPDDGDVWKCKIFQDSRIQLLVTPEPEPVWRPVNITFSSSTKIHLNVKLASSKMCAPLEMDVNDTVLKLKERIHYIEHVSVNNLVLHKAGTELHDHQLLRDCGVSDDGEIDVTIRSSSATVPATTVAAGTGVGGKGRGSKKLNAAGTGVGGRGGGSKKSNAAGTGVGGRGGGSEKLKIMILPKSGTEKIPIEVDASDNVGELRNELQKLHQRLQIDLPQDYFFIHKQDVMHDNRSFQWHRVGQGDTIEIFSGRVTGGS